MTGTFHFTTKKHKAIAVQAMAFVVAKKKAKKRTSGNLIVKYKQV